MGRRTADLLTQVRQCTLSKLEDRFGEIFSDPVLQPPPRKDPRRERPYSIRRTFWCFLWQILNENTSCRDVVRQLQAVLALHGILSRVGGMDGLKGPKANDRRIPPLPRTGQAVLPHPALREPFLASLQRPDFQDAFIGNRYNPHRS
jgi:hypothetical protein